MKVIIGSARSDENKKYSNGVRGDQRQSSVPDYKGEVSLQDFYVHSKGWVILRAKDKNVAKVMAALMHIACNNRNIGYSQSDRNSIMNCGVHTDRPANCDCSSLVRDIVTESTSRDIPDFNTSSEASVLLRTGMFVKRTFYRDKTKLYEGDILVTKTKGHTAIVVFGESRLEDEVA